MATLRTHNLTKSYGGRTVVGGVSLDVSSGEVVGLLGPNGAGKTTTFYMTVGLTAPASGRVELDGQDVTDDPMYVRARKGIGYLPQEPSIFRGLTVEQNLLAILETMELDGAARRARLGELLAELSLTPLAKSPAHTLSGGERRRVEITRALVISPKFMLLDEPFAGIDPIAVTDIQKSIFHLTQRGMGLLITDHDVRERLRITDPAYNVRAGRIFKARTPDSAAADGEADTWDDADYEYVFGDYLDDGYRSRAPSEVKELPPIENTLSTAASLSDHLMWQLSLQTEDEKLREIGGAIVGNLDDDGYLVASVEEIAAMGDWPVADVERALQHVQTFDPIGVAARDLQECLWLQIRHLGLEGTPTEKIVTEHLRLLQNHQVPEIARKLGMTIDDLKQHIEVIRHLDPKPGSRYNPTQSQYVIPDVYVMKVEDEYVVVLNEDGLPQMRISPVYRRLLDKSAADNTDETRAYVKDKFRSALWLIKSVEQRQKTIFKVAKSIVNFQRDFLDHGIEHLRPLVLRDVANDIGMHESTVSRVVTNKYMHTPQGVFEMKYFFHSGISSSYGESVSSVTIKQRIRKIIENEDPRKPLSDSKIVSILQREGLVLARRTIAKYREELKIPTSNQRKVLY